MQKKFFVKLFCFFAVVLSALLLSPSSLFGGRATSAIAPTAPLTSTPAENYSKYSLVDIQTYSGPTKNLTLTVGNQQSTEICWAFATISAFESTLNVSLGVEKTLNFSELDLAYTLFKENRGISIGGGVFELAYEYLAGGYGPVVEQTAEKANASKWTGNADATNDYAEFLATHERQMSGYTAFESILFPARSAIETDGNLSTSQKGEQILALRNSIKNHILNVGAVTSSIYYSSVATYGSYMCSYQNASENHMITLVGWDDTYEYNGHTGAYIALNSHGTNFGYGGYFYIMYDDPLVEDYVCGFKRVGTVLENAQVYNNMAGSSKENQFLQYNAEEGSVQTMACSINSTLNLANIYQVDTTINNQTIERIKVPTTSPTSRIRNTNTGMTVSFNHNRPALNFKVHILTNISSVSNPSSSLNTASMFNKITLVNPETGTSTFTANQTGYYTIELASPLSISGNYFAVVMECLDGFPFFYGNNYDEHTSMPTFMQAGASSWSEFAVNSKKSTIPMVVEASYPFGIFDYEIENGLSVGETKTVTYDGTNKCSAVTLTGSDTNPDSATISYKLEGKDDFSTNLPQLKNCGTYKVYFKIEAKTYVTISGDTYFFIIKIEKRNLVIIPTSNLTKVYGDSDPYFSFSYWNTLTGETPSTGGSLKRVAGEDVGTYKIINDTSSVDKLVLKDFGNFKASNYTFTVQDENFTITKRPLYITPTKSTKIYGEQDNISSVANVGFTFSNMAFNAVPNANLIFIREGGEQAGTYDIFIEAGSLELIETSNFNPDNYDPQLKDNQDKFEILPRPIYLSVTADYQKIFGATDPDFTAFTYANNLQNETPFFNANAKLSREAGETAGEYYSYAIDDDLIYLVDGPNFSAKNYTLEIAETSKKFFIALAQLVTGYTSQNLSREVVYNGALQSVGLSGLADGISVEYCETGTFNGTTCGPAICGQTHVGEKYISLRFVKTNYVPEVIENIKIKVLPKTITVTLIRDQSKTYGDQDNLVSLDSNYVSVSGAVGNETPALSGSLSRKDASVKEDVGVYEITAGTLAFVDGTNFSASDYTLVFATNGCKFKITKREITVSADNQSKFYDGTGDCNITFITSNTAFDDEINFVGSLAKEFGSNAGTYKILRGTLALDETSAKNYDLDFSSLGEFEIKRAPITIAVQDINCMYGEAVTPTYTLTSGEVYGTDSLGITFFLEIDGVNRPVTTKLAEGDHEIFATSNNGNYLVTVNTGTLTITYQTYEVTFKVSGYDPVAVNLKRFATIGDVEDYGVVTSKTGHYLDYWIFNGSKRVGKDEIKDMIIDVTNELETPTFVFETTLLATEYQIIYNLDGGELTTTHTTFTIEDAFTFDTPTKTGYNFLGFFEATQTGEQETSGIALGTTGNKTLTAKWSRITLNVTYPTAITDKFILNCAQDSVYYGDNFTFTITLDKKYSQSHSSIKVYAKSGEAKTEIPCIETQRKAQPAPLNFGENTIVHIDDSLTYGTKTYVFENVTKSFEIVVEGVELNKYTVKFAVDGENKGTTTLTYGSSFTATDIAPVIPTKAHFDRTAPVWSVPRIESLACSLTINAIYTPNVYSVKLILNGKEYKTTCVYGKAVDTSVLDEDNKLHLFEYYTYSSNLTGITDDNAEIFVQVKSNAYILYIVLGVVGAGIITLAVFLSIRKHKKHKFNWWIYKK